MNNKPFVVVTDARDGLYPSLRQIFSVIQMSPNKDRFQKSVKLAQLVADVIGAESDMIFDVLTDTTWPRCAVPLIDGLGNFFFPPAGPWFTEMKLSAFFNKITNGAVITDFHQPLIIPFPYVLVAGTLGYSYGETKIPPHKLNQVIDATIAVIKNPSLTTRELLNYISGPDLLVGGVIENQDDLVEIYETGSGIIQVLVSPENLNTAYFDDALDYCKWYGLKSRKLRLKEDRRIQIPYNAFLYDGNQTHHMSPKEILQCHIDYYRLAVQSEIGVYPTDEALCAVMAQYKTYSYGERNINDILLTFLRREK